MSVGLISLCITNEIKLSGPNAQTNPAKTGRMATTHLMSNPTSLHALTSKLGDYYTLTKPEVNLLILMTTSAGEDARAYT
jgi:hypothetical protein